LITKLFLSLERPFLTKGSNHNATKRI